MALPPKMNRGLPPLPFSSEEPDTPLDTEIGEFPLDEEAISYVGEEEENLEDDFVEISEENTESENDIKEEPIKEEETNSKEKSTKNNNTNKKKLNLNLSKIPIPVFKFPKISYKKIIIIISAVIIGLFLIGKISHPSHSSITEKNKDISYHYKREEYNGIVFSAKAKKDMIAKFQRVYKEKNENIVLCETDNLELSQNHEQEVFLTCMNNTEDIKNTNHKKITDNALEIK